MANYKRHRPRGRVSRKMILIASLTVTVLLLFAASLEITALSVLPGKPSLTLALVCAVGFLFGERAGAVAGIFGGVLISALGSVGFSLSPMLFLLCGYFCGILPGRFLVRNFPSFLIYGLVFGLLQSGFTLIYFGLFSKDFSLWKTAVTILLPEYLAFLACLIPSYGIVKPVGFLLKKG